jgi:hypothetical protein
LAQSKVVAFLPTSEFPSEIPRCQNRNFLYMRTVIGNRGIGSIRADPPYESRKSTFLGSEKIIQDVNAEKRK